MGSPTIRDVAERAGVSKSLVSLVLRGSGGVRPEKREAVLAAVEALGYRPNAAARSLSERRTRTVGVLLNDLRNPWFVDLLDGLNTRLYDNGLHMLLADGHLNRRLGEDLTRTFTELRVDGLIAVGTLQDPQALRTAAGLVPTVVAGTREPVLPGVDIVANDDEHGARLATEHLIGLGHRRIAHIAGRGAVGALRRRSFEATMREHGLAGTAVVEQGDLTEEGGYRAAVRLLSRPQRPTAVFAVNDMTCVGALSAAEECGLQVPRDLSLVGYDNTSLSRLRHLWLTTVDNASHDVGRRAAQRLLDRIEEPDRPGEVDLATPFLEVRGTTGPPPGT
ncbi:LacI family DNA-binding transcriptional regulator [Streptomyces sp. NBC_00557]|jgi:DNA-binding LacI/PurR family transcriptional regulator|uniref:LacI family DNA-binding transcriptional regulator n=1 Tax=Streptomyces sp. NBC_00557 TaxID=2975776 RepID=UPI002E80088A|nr:LacI family DNA-binding transcriptional regulator [Streptomyces sp. NBC_00557]WUC39052.1 LacI family transcriptional regulator [Streptomyces sp. NBC_00557]